MATPCDKYVRPSGVMAHMRYFVQRFIADMLCYPRSLCTVYCTSSSTLPVSVKCTFISIALLFSMSSRRSPYFQLFQC